MSNLLKVAMIDLILSLHRQGLSQRRIASELGINRETVARYLSDAKSRQNQPLRPPARSQLRQSQNQPLRPPARSQPRQSQNQPLRPPARRLLSRG